MWTNIKSQMKLQKFVIAINPKNEKGKITLISRFGHKNVENFYQN